MGSCSRPSTMPKSMSTASSFSSSLASSAPSTSAPGFFPLALPSAAEACPFVDEPPLPTRRRITEHVRPVAVSVRTPSTTWSPLWPLDAGARCSSAKNSHGLPSHRTPPSRNHSVPSFAPRYASTPATPPPSWLPAALRKTEVEGSSARTGRCERNVRSWGSEGWPVECVVFDSAVDVVRAAVSVASSPKTSCGDDAASLSFAAAAAAPLGRAMGTSEERRITDQCGLDFPRVGSRKARRRAERGMGGNSSLCDAGFVRRMDERWTSIFTFLRMGVETEMPWRENTWPSSPSSGEGAAPSVLARLDDAGDSSSLGRF
ncbi:hypothetical protein GSI_02455 [Ganoderma sinense ZZ0214-1]|uniref:Uncharacterized protein n=1 Tax=Ganoderma sinense ZZ0214-1 TaxID=1077348 RepID=A0A2G8SPN5_9APHY|nr:hypothetical protein GSI_02455 [Ganoderma sinense ZZ0214-1]